MMTTVEMVLHGGAYTFLGLYALCALVLCVYAVNCYVMMYLFHLRRKEEMGTHERVCAEFWARHTDASLPVVTTQLPVYNEANVVARLIHAVVAMDYPRTKHHIQVLDDSTDETSAVIAELVAQYRGAGVWIDHVQRGTREGYKAGALRHGMARGTGELLAIFDADFVPGRDFLRQMVPHVMADERCAAAQARWSYLNRRESVFTRAQSIGLDAHFAIEQGARAWNGLYMNFNGTAGIWRRAAIEAAGGWQDDTLTEDMDLSYRVQLAGWKLAFVFDVEVPCELPGAMRAYKAQQFRWAKGSLQTARKVLPAILRSRDRFLRKFEAVMHLTHHVIDPLIMVLVVCALPSLMVIRTHVHGVLATMILCGVFVLSVAAPAALHMYGQRALGERWWKVLPYIPLVSSMYTALLVSNCKAMYEALRGIRTPFVRTPKRGSQAEMVKEYRSRRDKYGWVELALGAYCAASLIYCVAHGQVVLAYFMFLNTIAFAYAGASSIMLDVSMRPAGATQHAALQ